MKGKIKFLAIVVLFTVLGCAMTACKEPGEDTPALTGRVSIRGTTHVGEILIVDVN